MRINFVLVDYENVSSLDLSNLDREDVRVIVFLGPNQVKLPAALVLQMQALGSRGEYVPVSAAGPNALDFHIAFTMGERSGREQPVFFHIISKDAGFDPLLKYMKAKKILAARYSSVAELPLLKAVPKTTKERVEAFAAKVNSPNGTKPRTDKTLSNAIRAMFQPFITDEEVAAVRAALVARKVLQITDGKVTYPVVGPAGT
jgi:hypothetical protein